MTAKSPEAKARKRERDSKRRRERKMGEPGYTTANRERARAYQRNLGREGRRANNLWNCHGMTPADKQAMLDAQAGRCYLCGGELAYEDAFIDHDHSCCPARPTSSCKWCRRGLACDSCNTIIGMAGEDPGRLRRIADSLAAALPLTAARLASKPEQLTLDAA